jgi:hypothetical protein
MCVIDEKKKQNADFLVDPVASEAGNNKNSVCFYTTRKGKKVLGKNRKLSEINIRATTYQIKQHRVPRKVKSRPELLNVQT